MVKILDFFVLVVCASEVRTWSVIAERASTSSGVALITHVHFFDSLNHSIHVLDVDFLPCITCWASQRLLIWTVAFLVHWLSLT